jgi:gas vesicle protein
MNNFLKGVLFGVGIGLLVAPMRGEEMRRRLKERVGEFQGYLPENEQLNLYTQRVTDRVSQTADSLKGYAQQAASTVKSTASSLSGTAKDAASEVKSASQDVASTTGQAVKSTQTNTTSTTSNPYSTTQ